MNTLIYFSRASLEYAAHCKDTLITILEIKINEIYTHTWTS